jgi:hypothetical protein
VKCSAHIEAGICGFQTTVAADSPDEQMVTLTIRTDCEKIRALAEVLNGRQIDAYEEIARGSEGVVLSAAREKLSGCCAACAVPVGIFKSVQVAARVALPKDIEIRMAPG